MQFDKDVTILLTGLFAHVRKLSVMSTTAPVRQHEVVRGLGWSNSNSAKNQRIPNDSSDDIRLRRSPTSEHTTVDIVHLDFRRSILLTPRYDSSTIFLQIGAGSSPMACRHAADGGRAARGARGVGVGSQFDKFVVAYLCSARARARPLGGPGSRRVAPGGRRQLTATAHGD